MPRMSVSRSLLAATAIAGTVLLAQLLGGHAALAGECREFIELKSAADVAREYGKTEMWVLQNVKINVWEKGSSAGKGRKVGELNPGSRALVLEEGPDDYRVQSPLDHSTGWVSKVQVSHTLKQDTESFEPCGEAQDSRSRPEIAPVTTQATVEDTPENRRAQARRYLQVASAKKMLSDVAEKMGTGLPDEKRRQTEVSLLEHFDLDALESFLEDALVKHFNATELSVLADFYGSPVGRSVMEKFPSYMAELGPFLQQEVEKAAQRMTTPRRDRK